MLSWLLSLRWLMMVPSVGTGLGALLMFWIGAIRISAGLVVAATDSGNTKGMIVDVMGATDAFIFGVVLLIFSLALAFGFVFEPPVSIRDKLPDWVRIGGISGLKRTLMEVIVLYLTVDFATYLAEAENPVGWQALVMPASVVLIAGAARLLRESGGSAHGDVEADIETRR